MSEHTLKNRVWEILELPAEGDRLSRFFDLLMIALILVSVQGTLGGLRVIEESVPLAIIHGVLGQLTFATLASIAAVTSTTWLRRANVLTSPSASTDRPGKPGAGGLPSPRLEHWR